MTEAGLPQSTIDTQVAELREAREWRIAKFKQLANLAGTLKGPYQARALVAVQAGSVEVAKEQLRTVSDFELIEMLCESIMEDSPPLQFETSLGVIEDADRPD